MSYTIHSTQTMNEKTRQQNIIHILKKTYPKAHIALHYHTSWELLVAVILSAQCTDTMVNKVTEKLFLKYPTLDAYCRADPKEFEQDIRQTGFYHTKTKHILAASTMIQTTFGGTVPNTMEKMLTIPGVARKTANVVLGNAYGVVEGIAVDTHVIRLSQRLRLVSLNTIGGKHAVFITQNIPRTKNRARIKFIITPACRQAGAHQIDFIKDADPVKIEKTLMTTIPKKDWFSLTYQLINHGRAVCKAQNPHCVDCPLRIYCPVKRNDV